MPKSFTYPYPRPMVTVDLVVFGLGDDGLRSLFIRRKKPPFAGCWAIPGGYLEIDESFLAGSRRELQEEAGLTDLVVVEEIGTFGEPGRDPRGRTISIAHAGIVRSPLPEVSGHDDASAAAWLDPNTLVDLAFDHAQIQAKARLWLSEGLANHRFFFEFLPNEFTDRDVAKVLKLMPGRRTPISRWIKAAIKTGKIEAIDTAENRFCAVVGV